MREIEILVELKDTLQKAKGALSKFEYKGSKQTIDTYFYDSKRENLKLSSSNKLMECCRIREKNGTYFITYKIDNYINKIWQYSDEYETEVKDINAAKQIFKCLGLEELVVVNNIKHTYETTEYEIVIEEVENLGLFLEVEYLNDNETRKVEDIKSEIYTFIKELGLNIGEELNSGKPELLLNKH